MSGVAIDVASDGWDTAATVSAMMARMAHRGPDAAALLSTSSGLLGASVGQLSLWATPEDEGLSGPAIDDAGRIIAFDGRLDDRASLAAALSLDPAVPDRTLAARAIARWGPLGARRLIGDFAFVIWSPRESLLFACRDRIGAVPLYFFEHDHGLRMASEKRALACDARLRPSPALEPLALALVDEYTERDQTILARVESLAPGHYLTWSPRGRTVSAYWTLDLDRKIRFADERAYADDLREVLTHATRDRLRARGRIAIAVSGGLDSSAVAAVAIAGGSGGVPAPRLATVRYPGLACDESRYSDRLAQHLGVPLAPVDMSNRPEALAPRDIGDLLYDPTVAGYEAMARATGARVFLTGWGSDELQWWTGREPEHAVRSWALGDALRWSGVFDDPLAGSRWRVLASATVRALGLRRGHPLGGPGDPIPSWLTARGEELVREGRERRLARLGWLRDRSPVEQILAAGLTDGLQVPFGLSHLSQLGAALAVEMRHPFFDVRVIERVLAYPLHVRCSFDLAKPLLRQVVEPMLPPVLTWRTSRPSFVPFFQHAANVHARETMRLFAGHRLETLGLVRAGESARVALDAPHDEQLVRELGSLVAMEAWLATTCRL